MRYFYLSREALKYGQIVQYDVFDLEVPIEIYRTGQGKEDAIQYIGDFIPNDLIYDEENDVVFSEADRPSPYHIFIKGTWIIKDKEKYKEYCHEEIDKVKAEILEYGFDYLIDDVPHRQRCRDKDIAYMVATVTGLQLAKQIFNKDVIKKWYFEDDFGADMNLIEIGTLMLYGMNFIQSVFDTESFFKNLEEPRIITRLEFENKRKEIHRQLVGA
ncbi:hypothetical protein [Fusobacterium sp.]|uniref:hypothetical protein n=1 Tax=Fusobacterium sp. TaxID=68766 RepID=UPI0025BDC3A8|nr:hypothetical protein [Fusobacterium sp.]MCI5725470.1 hypothetical protein [Fusobacterium sp.]